MQVAELKNLIAQLLVWLKSISIAYEHIRCQYFGSHKQFVLVEECPTFALSLLLVDHVSSNTNTNWRQNKVFQLLKMLLALVASTSILTAFKETI